VCLWFLIKIKNRKEIKIRKIKTYMCLVVEKDKFGRSFREVKSDWDSIIQVSDRDKWVYKVLRVPPKKGEVPLEKKYTKQLTHFSTPYMGKLIDPNGEIMTVDNFSCDMDRLGHLKISRGIHSHVKKLYGLCFSGSVMVKSLIPSGTPYIVGTNNDIVSLMLLIPPIDERSIVDSFPRYPFSEL